MKRRNFASAVLSLLGLSAVLPRGQFLCESCSFKKMVTEDGQMEWIVTYRLRKETSFRVIVDPIGKIYRLPIFEDGGKWKPFSDDALVEDL